MGKQQKQLLSKEVLDQITEHAAKVAMETYNKQKDGRRRRSSTGGSIIRDCFWNIIVISLITAIKQYTEFMRNWTKT